MPRYRRLKRRPSSRRTYLISIEISKEGEAPFSIASLISYNHQAKSAASAYMTATISRRNVQRLYHWRVNTNNTFAALGGIIRHLENKRKYSTHSNNQYHARDSAFQQILIASLYQPRPRLSPCEAARRRGKCGVALLDGICTLANVIGFSSIKRRK